MHKLRLNYKKRLILFFLILISNLIFSDNVQAQNKGKIKTVVIDAGHGGKDPGAPGKTSATSEKNLVLKISKLFGEKIKSAYPDVKVIYTRDSDKFIGLHERAMVARRNNADLFISIHCNSVASKSAYGTSVHILGQRSDNSKNKTDYFERNMSVAQQENSVIILEEDYKTKYMDFDPDSPESYISHQLQWMAYYESSLLFASEVVDNLVKAPLRPRKAVIDQDIFQVLVETNMPSVLLELAFVTNPTEYKYLSSADGQKEIAQRLFNAFKSYKTKYDMSLNLETSPVVAAETPQIHEPVEKDVEELTAFYAVQIMSVAKLLKSDDPQLKGLKAEPYRPAGASAYKYIIGISTKKINY